jgi:hypothetical protein
MARGPIPDRGRRPTVAEIQPLVDAYYQLSHCGVGGGLHVVLDDDNWSDRCIQDCIDDAPTHWAGHVEVTQALGRLLLLLTRTQRKKMDAGYGGAFMPEHDLLARCQALIAQYAPLDDAPTEA